MDNQGKPSELLVEMDEMFGVDDKNRLETFEETITISALALRRSPAPVILQAADVCTHVLE